MKQQLNYDFKEVQAKLANKIAILEVQLATEQAAKQAVIKYAEELEKQVEDLTTKEESDAQ
ncbi:hypothetical protein [Halalkalibacter hemicellulosilyticus]|uniref:Uncharacterized protein n=1 Tax=Halalkalibacter hemicellulosilyticusJCM 9152 TaxID=1236971 RepID=W4QK61_9BACI|nr:hypothetical protein [Halalkalibacter hemicellulosilyticus]GAE32456.1 hypothetical protein JCM9152_3991 [Halalkalibacter hemicellulosilyticusJCM 9152]